MERGDRDKYMEGGRQGDRETERQLERQIDRGTKERGGRERGRRQIHGGREEESGTDSQPEGSREEREDVWGIGGVEPICTTKLG